jgi:hypothetical protein
VGRNKIEENTMITEVKVGPQLIADGAPTTVRGERTGAMVITQLHGAFTESARYGNVMVGANAVAGIAPGTALSTAPPFSLWNPLEAEKNCLF